jgi:uncharacterized protein YlxW (UPF0749 family)
MSQEQQSQTKFWRPEIFWVLFILVSCAVFMGVVEPARQDEVLARKQTELIRSELRQARKRMQDLKREREALKRNDPEALRAAAYAFGLDRFLEDQDQNSDPRLSRRTDDR